MRRPNDIELGGISGGLSMTTPSTWADSETEYASERHAEKVELVGQMKVPVYQKPHFWSPDFVKCDGKIIKYNMRALGIWRALVSCSHTILTDWETWSHMSFLLLVGTLTAVFVIFTGLNKTLGEASPVTSRISLLISFILSAYITITVNRWDRIRNGTLGALWGALENLNMIAQRILLSNALVNKESLEAENLASGEELVLTEELIRLSRLTMVLTFKAVQDLGPADQLLGLVKLDLISEEERRWLLEALPGTRPLMVVTWMEGFISKLESHGYTVPKYLQGLAGMQLNNIRGGVGATLGAIGAQLPYPYVHIVYWTVQLLLAITAVQYGCDIGVEWYSKANGNGDYSPDTGDWPKNQVQWWTGQIFVNIAGFTIFALFCEGIMNICAKLSNPMSTSDIAFSEKVYAAFMYNNCKALRSGLYAYHAIQKKLMVKYPHSQLKGPVRRGGATGGSGTEGAPGHGINRTNGPTARTNSDSDSAPRNNDNSVRQHGEHSVMGTTSQATEGAFIRLAVAIS